MGNIFERLPAMLDEEMFETLLNSDGVKIERIISRGHVTPDGEWYDQPQNEWVLILQGAAILTFDDKPAVRLEVGDYLNIPSHQKHRLDWTDSTQETIWLAVHYLAV